MVGPVAQRFGEWAPASRTFSAITDIIAVIQREVDRLFAFIFKSMYAPSTSPCLPAMFSPSRHRHEMCRWRALWPYATAASRRQSRAAGVTVQAPVTTCSL